MPGLGNKGKGKGRERRSRSRNTTPNSALSANTGAGVDLSISYLDNDVSKLLVPANVQYADILEKLGGAGQIPDPKALESLADHLRTLGQLAEARGDSCNAGLRELSQRKKEILEEQRAKEQLDREAEERLRMKREAEDDEEEGRILKAGRLKKRKERSMTKEERPLTHGAHGVARQDGFEPSPDGKYMRAFDWNQLSSSVLVQLFDDALGCFKFSSHTRSYDGIADGSFHDASTTLLIRLPSSHNAPYPLPSTTLVLSPNFDVRY